MKKIKNKLNQLAVRGYIKSAETRTRVMNILTAKNGEGFVDTALVRHVSN